MNHIRGATIGKERGLAEQFCIGGSSKARREDGGQARKTVRHRDDAIVSRFSQGSSEPGQVIDTVGGEVAVVYEE